MSSRDDTAELASRPSGGGFKIAPKLVVVAGTDEGLEVPLERSIEVGTDPTCGLVLHDPAVSRRHAAFKCGEGSIAIKDLGSRNGTFLGGTRLIEAEVPLGAVVQVGNSSLAVQSRWFVREVAPSTARRFGDLHGESVAMRELFAILERVAATTTTILIEGESGTGKELAARSIHQQSARAHGPYVVFDCGAVPKELAESELFGHERGAFSGAIEARAGAFSRADGGTLCLDEIGELPLELQPKLLRALETGEVRSVGSDVSKRVDVRIVAATNRDLASEVRQQRFRSDLLYRLEVVKVRIPPLRHRPQDIPKLVELLLEGRVPPGDRAEGENLARLMAYSWPGNVRELRNVLARAVALAASDGTAAPFSKLIFNLGPAPSAPATIGSDFPGIASPLPFKIAKAQLLESFERAYVGALLERHRGKIIAAAAAAGLSKKHLYELVRKVTGDSSDPT
jgi:DNA-binding NtrC family response regulator